jgi:arylsulfatase A-like enzyme
MSTQQPNILFIITDEQIATAMACVRGGQTHGLKTPNMDYIANNGTRFDQAYCTFPLCTPSRASLFSGRMPSEFGINNNTKGLPEDKKDQELGHLLSKAGYECAYAGKWHLHNQRMTGDHGFEVLSPMDDPLAANVSSEFIRRPHDKPFFLVTSFFQPHGCCPFHRYPDPRECKHFGLDHYAAFSEFGKDPGIDWPEDAFSPEFVNRCPPLPANFSIGDPEPEIVKKKRNNRREIDPGNRPKFYRPQEIDNAAREWDDDTYRYYLYAYDRLVEWLDTKIGILLDALRESGHAENTLVVFTSDHGDQNGAHRLTAKNVFYEESVRIPLAICYPGHLPAGQVNCGQLVSNGLDILPTLCDFAGAKTPEGLTGRSLRPLLEGRDHTDWRSQLVIEANNGRQGHGQMLHDARYTYMNYGSGSHAEEFFDLQTDPGQLKNLINDPACADLIAECRAVLRNGSADPHPVT